MPVLLIGIRRFAERLECSPSYISKLISFGVLKKVHGKLDPVASVKSMRNSTLDSSLNLSGFCLNCDGEEDQNDIGRKICQRCIDKRNRILNEVANMRIDLSSLKVSSER